MPEDDMLQSGTDDVELREDQFSVEVEELPESQRMEAEKFALEFLGKVIRLRGVRIDREHFLAAELHRRGLGTTAIERALAESPAAAGIPLEELDRIAASVVEFETRKSTAMSFAAGIPGGFAMIGTIPGDVTQFYVHAFRIMQKVAYVYGWKDLLTDVDAVDDETLGKLAAFLGVMMGVGGASATVTNFASSVARPAVQKQIAGVALTKTTWFGPMKNVLRVIGVKLTKDSFAKATSKVVPVAGGVISGGLTYTTLRLQSRRLIKHLRQLPPPGVDAEQYLALLHAVDETEAERAGASLQGRITTAAGALRDRLPSPRAEENAGGRARAAAKEAGARAERAVGSVKGRVDALFTRKTRGGEAGADEVE
ncbi:hypothetical protein [Brachybacterium phenoliresistens]|uniref:hypothetical protein n=1 Tax=Brachybacterium phenoliresistens TaxID=396014 RepID=UPI0031DF7925